MGFRVQGLVYSSECFPLPRPFNLVIELVSPRASVEPSSASQASGGGCFKLFPGSVQSPRSNDLINLGGSSLCKDQGVGKFQGGRSEPGSVAYSRLMAVVAL